MLQEAGLRDRVTRTQSASCILKSFLLEGRAGSRIADLPPTHVRTVA
jgi:hypothetical protein